MDDVLDLDALLPEPRKIKLHGKILLCNPLTISQLLKLSRLENDLKQVKNDEEIYTFIMDALKPIVPDLDDVNFTITQLFKLVQYLQEIQIPKDLEKAKDYTVKKKLDSQEESPTSSDSTQDTQSET